MSEVISKEGAEMISKYLQNKANNERYKRNLAVSLLIECNGREWEVKNILAQAQKEYDRLVKGDRNEQG